jgi:hypothetical protein
MTDGKSVLSRLEAAALVMTQTDLLGLQQLADDDEAPAGPKRPSGACPRGAPPSPRRPRTGAGDVASAGERLKLAAAADAIAAQHGERSARRERL